MDAQRLIFHHYEASPYAEKIRLMFGRAGMAWYSVLSPVMPPRPNIDPLSGGYRRIPIAQVGADVFCDTALIAEELVAMTAVPTLAPTTDQDDVATIVERAEKEVFFAAISSVSPLKLIGRLIANFGLTGMIKFIKDRTKMMESAAVKPPRGEAAARVFDQFMTDLDVVMSTREFLTDGDAPGYEDFAVYHPIWLRLSIEDKPVSDSYPNVRRWYDQVTATGHGTREELDASMAFTAARDSEPRPVPDSEPGAEHLEQSVTVAPADYGKVPVEGILVALTPDRIVLARDTDDYGRIHVHFPREGYEIGVR